ncbi:MAG: restriction endonuclease subunit S [Finegoldia magna]|uniref:restriction endonuclease subunit S n=1 Tax=Finegoldia magna TaxID=1260 RepID=UPI0026EE456C|nr:restriction endonuclease subunit S [Finegoldia magna]MBS5776086.1 restriction endonuclease subunit S [Finegoldia magna]MDU2574938.1 restriction endonuclease subunit S [Finegoldia magna]MDU2898415.1 restriction endonuclease subunit S [Finegoldia magna]MDU5223700.1 restriction endonuclease subunit S [Finegoldia magna]MDU5368995.1 restriction endonuclease subunit S [Finegoldia magna]
MIEVKLKDIAINITDGKHGDCANEEHSGFYFVSCKDVHDGAIHYDNARQITEKDFIDTHKRTMLEPNDILITNSGTIGRMALVKDIPQTYKTTFQKSVAIIKPNQEIVRPSYLYYSLINCVSQFINKSNGSAQKNLLLGTMREFKIKIEDNFDKQDKIDYILSSYDDLIENNKNQIHLLEEAAQRLYKEWFVDLRFPGYEDVELVNGVPKGWTYKRVEEFGEVITGKTPSTSKTEYYGGNIPFITIPDMHGKVFPLITEKTLTKVGADTQKNKYLPANTVIVSCIATVGLVNIAIEPCQTNQQINSVILHDDNNLYFFYESMKRIKALLDGVGSNGATMTNVNKTKFSSIKVLYPTEDLVIRYNEFCKHIFDKILMLSKGILLYKQARDRLLPKLMSGEIEL